MSSLPAIRLKLRYKNVIFIHNLRKFSKLSYVHHPGDEPLRYLTIGKLLEQAAQKYGDRPAIISKYQNETLTFQEAFVQADKLAAGLKTIGLNVGDRVGIWAPNIIEWYVTHMACARGGYILVTLNSAYQAQEMEYCINSVGMKGIICAHKFKTQNYYEHLVKIAPDITNCSPGKLRSKSIPTLDTVIVASDANLRGTFSYRELLELPSEKDVRSIQTIQESINPEKIAHLQFTSGTTGQPKIPINSHFQLINNSYFFGKRNELDTKHHVVCIQVPFFHVFGTSGSICGALHHGSTLVLPAPSFDPDKSLDALRDEKCTVLYGTPTMYVDLIERQKKRKEEINPQIAVTGAASCSPHLFNEIRAILKVQKVKSAYGMTETTGAIFQSLFNDSADQTTSTVGHVSEHIEAKIVDSEGKIVPRGTPGELLVRGYTTTEGYWQNAEKTRELIGSDKWLRTGDQFILDENNYGKIVGRMKELIIRGGENIFPKDIEDVLNTHPDILEAHVVGIPHQRLGEEICACIRTQPNVSLTLDDINSYCKGKIAHFKIPSLLELVESFPKTTSGKIQKFKLVENFVNSRK